MAGHPDRATDGGGMPPDDVQTLDNVLADADVRPRTRRWLVGAALGAGAAGAFGPLATVLAKGDSVKKVGTIAVTAEALAVTYLSNLIQSQGSRFPAQVGEILKAANAAEQAHYELLKGAGFQPLATKFWVPDSAVSAKNAPAVIEKLETLFVNAYLVATTVFAKAGKADLARYAGEIAGVEAQHRVLARELQGKLPNNVGFESYRYTSLDDIVGQITDLGVGIGKKGKGTGRFYTYSGPLAGTTAGLANSGPDQHIADPLPSAGGDPVMTG